MLEHTTILFFATYPVAIVIWRLTSRLSHSGIRKVMRYSLVYLSLPFIYLSPKFSILTNVWTIILGNISADYVSSGSAAVVVVLLVGWAVVVFVAMVRADRIDPDRSASTPGENAFEQLAVEGGDLDFSTGMSFAIEAPDEVSAAAIRNALVKNRYISHIQCLDGAGNSDGSMILAAASGTIWMVYADVAMPPKPTYIIRVKNDLARIAEPYGGKYRGLKKTSNAHGF